MVQNTDCSIATGYDTGVVHHLYDLNKQKRFILMLENVKLDETNLKSFCVIYSALLVLSHECGLTDMKNHEEALSKRS